MVRNEIVSEMSAHCAVRYGSTLLLIRGEFGKKFMCHCKVSVRLFTSCTLNRFNFFGLQRSLLCKLEHSMTQLCINCFIYTYIRTYIQWVRHRPNKSVPKASNRPLTHMVRQQTGSCISFCLFYLIFGLFPFQKKDCRNDGRNSLNPSRTLL